jgi:hypothetical protein
METEPARSEEGGEKTREEEKKEADKKRISCTACDWSADIRKTHLKHLPPSAVEKKRASFLCNECLMRE